MKALRSFGVLVNF